MAEKSYGAKHGQYYELVTSRWGDYILLIQFRFRRLLFIVSPAPGAVSRLQNKRRSNMN